MLIRAARPSARGRMSRGATLAYECWALQHPTLGGFVWVAFPVQLGQVRGRGGECPAQIARDALGFSTVPTVLSTVRERGESGRESPESLCLMFVPESQCVDRRVRRDPLFHHRRKRRAVEHVRVLGVKEYYFCA